MIKEVEKAPYYETAVYSAGGTVQAAESIWTGQITNAFVFTGCGDHHAGENFFGGWCYFNGAALAISNLRKRYRARKFAIIDTDAHHGDGTWSLFEEDEEVLYICLCSGRFIERKNKVNISLSYYVSDEEYLAKVMREVIPRCQRFHPELIFWNWGYDGTRGEYGDMGLTADCHPKLAEIIKGAAEEICQGKLTVVLCGGHSREIARYAIPRIISHLANLDEKQPGNELKNGARRA